jgi:hypothetical protein
MFESFLELAQCNDISAKGGHHQKWTRSDLNRPIIFQKTIDPVPEFIIKNNLRILGVSKKEFYEILESVKTVVKVKAAFQIVESKKQ